MKTKWTARWAGQIIAQSDDCVEVEGNQYFPDKDVNKEFLKFSGTRTICPWKGEAHYYNVVVNGKTNEDAAWYYPDPKEDAKIIDGRIAFWRGVDVSEEK